MNMNKSSSYRFLVSNFIAFMTVFSLSFDLCALGIATDAEALLEQAELVIVGKVIKQTGEILVLKGSDSGDQDTYQSVMTRYHIEIIDTLKGVYESNEISVYSFGGSVGDEVVGWSFGYDFDEGDNVLLLLYKSKANSVWMAVEQSMGAFLLKNCNGKWKVSSMNSDHVISRDGSDPREIEKQKYETLELYINGGEK